MIQKRIEKYAIIIYENRCEVVFDCFIFTDNNIQIIEFESKEELINYAETNKLLIIGEQNESIIV